MYNWPQTRRSEAINRIETRRVVKRMLNKFGGFSRIGIGKKSGLDVSGACLYCISLKHISIIRQHDSLL